MWASLALAAGVEGARARDWRVLETRGDRVYLAAPDSATAQEGQRLTLIERRDAIAIVHVTQVIDGVLVVARIDSGSVARVRRLERLRVRAEAAVLAPPTVLRVGIPLPARHSLLFLCPASGLSPPGADTGVYRREPAGDAATRWVRGAGTGEPSWPDTVIVVGFGVASDEEIAFERGDLDVAMFWPGELSARLRDAPRWGGAWRGRRPRGVVALQRLGDGGPITDSTQVASLDGIDLGALNARLFRGDLAPWPEPVAGTAPAPRMRPDRVRFEVDAALPGARAVARALDRDTAPRTALSVRVMYLDTPNVPVATVERSLRALGARPVFAVRGTLMCRPELRAYVTRLGVETLMARWTCDAAEPEP